MSASEILRDALFGNPPSATAEPSREGTLAAFTQLEKSVAGAVAGIVYYATGAERVADTANQPVGKIGKAADETDYYRREGAGWVVDNAVYEGVAAVVQPEIDAAVAVADAAQEQSGDARTGLAFLYQSPNLWPDPDMTGTGWSGPMVTGTSADGRKTITATGVNRWIRLPVSAVGGVGGKFSAGVDVDAVNFAGGQGVNVIVRQIRQNGTSIDALSQYILDTGVTTSTRQTVRAEALTVDVEAENGFIELYLLAGGNPANSVTISLPLIAEGDSAAFRPVMRSGPVAPGPQMPDFYVDGRPGPNAASDANDGTSEYTAFRTIAAALAAVAGQPGKTIGVLRGSVFRGQSINQPAGVNLQIIAFGEGAMPRFYGSDAYSPSRLTSLGGGQYSLALGYEPSTCAMRNVVTGEVVKLYGPDGNPTPPAAGNWAWVGMMFYINPGFDIAGWVLEVPRNDGVGAGFRSGAAGQTIRGIAFEFWRGEGVTFDHDENKAFNCGANYNGQDGFDQNAGAQNFLLSGGTAIANGRRRGAASGPGDGSSAHFGATGKIIGVLFKDNCQTGVGNLPDTQVEVTRCLFIDNFADLQIYPQSGSSTVPLHRWHHNVIIHRGFDGAAIASRAKGYPAGVLEIDNNTIYYADGFTGDCGYFDGMDVKLRNNIVYALGKTNAFANYVEADGSSGKITSVNNLFRVAGAPWPASLGPSRGGGSETGVLTDDPLFADPDGDDFSLQPGSPAIDSGVVIAGYTEDYQGSPVGNPPNRGALEA